MKVVNKIVNQTTLKNHCVKVGLTLTSVFLFAGVGLLPSPWVQAQSATSVVQFRGTCSNRSKWRLKTAKNNAKIELEFEVNQVPKIIGQKWAVVITDNGNTIFKGARLTQAPDASFVVKKLVPDLKGIDNIVAKATNPKTKEICKFSVAVIL
ncbi:MAG TPA: hypothetical protein V6D19_22440 [Stenomitos sp.]